VLGLVFTELLAELERTASLDGVDRVLAEAGVRGAYTAYGNYPDAEAHALIHALAAERGDPVEAVQRTCGRRLFARFAAHHPEWVDPHADPIALLERLEDHVHASVRMVYADADPPRFDGVRLDGGGFRLTYRSHRGMAALAEGLLRGAFDHYGLDVRLEVEGLAPHDGTHARFDVWPEGAA
jgi:hypothetical protein